MADWSCDIKAADSQVLLGSFRVFFRKQTIRESCRKMNVIQDIDFHIPFSCLVQHDINVPPPVRTAELRVRP